MRNFVGAGIAALVLAGCGSNPTVRSTPGLAVIEGAERLPAPSRGDLVAQDRLSLVGPLDTIAVDVFGVPELSRSIQVDAGGRIAMPLIGTLDAGGKTASELASDIASQLAGRYVRDPNVSVNIVTSVSQVVTVEGQVVEPGLYPVTNQMTLLRALASARGMTEFAKVSEVVILRNVNGQRIAGLYDIDAIRRGLYDDPAIYANDIVVVGDSPQRRLFRDLVSLAPLLAAPVIAIFQ
jgi:polysaccharide biosynthesis/export protein